MRILNRLALVLTMTTIGLVGPACSKPSNPTSTQSGFLLDQNARDSLLKNFAKPISERIRRLTDLGFLACQPLTAEEAAFAAEQGFKSSILGPIVTEMNCFGAVIHALSGKTGLAPVYSTSMEKELWDLGYQQNDEIVAVATNRLQQAAGLVINLDELDLQPGDVILLGWRLNGSGPRNLNHAALYLGKHDSHHYVFSKSGAECGPRSTFHYADLEILLSHKTGQPVETNVGFDRMFVYRHVE
ncbi:MAG: hypothetical protein ABH823_00340 [bacterium]